MSLAQCLVPEFTDEVAAEDEAEDEDACAKDDHVDVEGKVLETDWWH